MTRSSVSTIGWMMPSQGLGGSEAARRKMIFKRWLQPGMYVDIIVPQEAPDFINGPNDVTDAVDAMVSYVKSEESTKYSVLVIAGAVDLGISAVRRASAIPVIGPLESSLWVAHVKNKRVGAISTDDHIEAGLRRATDLTPYGDELISMSIRWPVEKLVSELPMNDPGGDRKVFGRILNAAAALKNAGANCIYWGSMTLGTLDLEQVIKREIGLDVLNPNRVALEFAQMRCFYSDFV